MTDQTLKLITIDGPSASGKSSIARILAKKLNWPWVSTGVFYRGLALLCLEKSVFDPKELDSFSSYEREISSKIKILTELVNNPCWKVEIKREGTQVFISEKNRTADIFSERIALLASGLSQISQVRQALLKPQRDCFIPETGLVAEGRDCGSVVFPRAKVKIYLTANEETRALRRYRQEGNYQQHWNEKYRDGIGADITHQCRKEENNFKKNLEAQTLRDKQDSSRKTAPLTIPQGAFVIDSTSLNENEVVKLILDYSQTCYL